MYIFSCLWQKFQVVFVGRHSKCFVDGRRAAIWSSLAALCVSSTKWCISCSHQKKLEKAWWPIYILLLWYLLLSLYVTLTCSDQKRFETMILMILTLNQTSETRIHPVLNQQSFRPISNQEYLKYLIIKSESLRFSSPTSSSPQG